MEWTPTGDISELTLKALDDMADGGRGLDEGLESALESGDEAARRIQRKIVYSVEKGDIVLDTNLQKGN